MQVQSGRCAVGGAKKVMCRTGLCGESRQDFQGVKLSFGLRGCVQLRCAAAHTENVNLNPRRALCISRHPVRSFPGHLPFLAMRHHQVLELRWTGLACGGLCTRCTVISPCLLYYRIPFPPLRLTSILRK